MHKINIFYSKNANFILFFYYLMYLPFRGRIKDGVRQNDNQIIFTFQKNDESKIWDKIFLMYLITRLLSSINVSHFKIIL